MNNKIFFDTIDNNKVLKLNVFNEYVRQNILPSLCKTYNTCCNYETYLKFLDNNIYQFKTCDPICDMIDDIDNHITTFENYKLQIIGKINDFIKTIKDRIEIKFDDIKKRYFHLEQIKFTVITRSDTVCIQYFYNNSYYNTYDVIRFNEIFKKQYNEKDVDALLDRILIKHSQRIAGQKLSNIIQELYYVEFSDAIKDNTIFKKSGLSKDILVISDKALYDKQFFEKVFIDIKQIFDDEIKLKYIKDFIEQFPFRQAELPNNKPFNLELGILNKNYDYHNDINNFYQQLHDAKDQYDYLSKSATLIEMKDILLMDKLSINYKETKQLNGDEYIIYLCKRKKSKKYIFFKNGIRIGRSKYHEVAKTVGYCFDIDVDQIHNKNWDLISKMPLTKEKIELYCDKLNWNLISRYRKLDNDMLIKYAQYINWEYVLLNRNISWRMVIKLSSIIGWSVISRYWKGINKDFINKHLYDLDIELVYQNPACKSFKDTIEILMS